MSYSTPRTWSAGETVTASLMNAHLRDSLNAISPKVAWISIGSPDGAVIATGVKARVWIPFPCKIVGWTILADQSGSIVIDVWKDSYANHPPTVADTIAGTEKPTLSSAQKNQDLTLTTWTQNIAAGDILFFNIDSVATLKQVFLGLSLEPL